MKSYCNLSFIIVLVLLFTQSKIYGQKEKTSVKKSNATEMENQDTTTNTVYFIDKFYVPKSSVNEFKQKANYNRTFIKTLAGYINGEAFEQTDTLGNLTILTIATWENQEYLDNAKSMIQAEFKRAHFNPTEFYQRLNIKLERGVYQELVE
ncbi:hypothetical protein [Flavobacterium sp. 5]|uniref:hypothetical protein n=1 Tax=Flavobacterium sp. 5 TaxID=2035199 RepID=UPI0012FD4AB0|nr:hypothetical protein [Flavobacterium sp. 5]